jgi:hypothetical protein
MLLRQRARIVECPRYLQRLVEHRARGVKIRLGDVRRRDPAQETLFVERIPQRARQRQAALVRFARGVVITLFQRRRRRIQQRVHFLFGRRQSRSLRGRLAAKQAVEKILHQ